MTEIASFFNQFQEPHQRRRRRGGEGEGEEEEDDVNRPRDGSGNAQKLLVVGSACITSFGLTPNNMGVKIDREFIETLLLNGFLGGFMLKNAKISQF